MTNYLTVKKPSQVEQENIKVVFRRNDALPFLGMPI
jgi:hypothetical protein